MAEHLETFGELGLIRCAVCTSSEGPFESYHGQVMHETCAPGPWRKDREHLSEFLELLERRRERLL
jgi:hypothetical protein